MKLKIQSLKYNTCASCKKDITNITIRQFSKTFCRTRCVIRYEEDQNVLNYFKSMESDKK